MPARILIAEDDDLQGPVLRDALEGRGYTADIARNGLDAVRQLRTGRYDLAVIDYRIPDIDGLAAARLTHDLLGEFARPRLIAVTASADELNAQAKEGGDNAFDAVVSKDVGLPALLAVIDANLASGSELKVAIAAAERRRASVRAGAAPCRKHLLGTQSNTVHAISIMALKEAAGSRWNRIGLSTMMKAEAIIKGFLSSGDVMVRSSDHAFIIWFRRTDMNSNQAVLAKVIRGLRLRFLSEFSEDTAAAAYSGASEVAHFLPGLQGL
jgi:CheY-like chemotaxis protein